MWEYWFEAIVIFMLLGISGRIYMMGRELSISMIVFIILKNS